MEKDKQNENDVQDQTGAQGASGEKEQQAGDQQQQQEQQQTQEKTFTQKQVNQMMAREKKQGRMSVYQELGLNPDDAKTMAMVKALIESTKTEEQKVQEQQAQSNAKVAEAEQRAMMAEAKAEAMQFGAQAQYVDDVVTLAISKMSDNTDLKTILGELKTKYPVWFTEGENDGDDKNKGAQATGQKGTGSSVKGSDKSKGSGTVAGLGKRLAAQRRSGSDNKKSFWG